MVRAAAFIIMALIFIAAVKASFELKPPEGAFLIDEAEATAIVCNPTIPRDIKQERFKGVQKT
jgi:hypothetical protein